MKSRKNKVFCYQPSRFRTTAPSPDSIQVEALGGLFRAPPHPVRRSPGTHAQPSPRDLHPGPQAPVRKTDLRMLLVRKHGIKREKAKADEGKKEGSTERRRESAFERLGGRLEGPVRTPGEEKGRPDESVETPRSEYFRQRREEENGLRVAERLGKSARGTKRSLEVGGASDRGSLEVPGEQKRAKVSPVFSRLTPREEVGRQPEEKRGSDSRSSEAPRVSAITQGGKKEVAAGKGGQEGSLVSRGNAPKVAAAGGGAQKAPGKGEPQFRGERVSLQPALMVDILRSKGGGSVNGGQGKAAANGVKSRIEVPGGGGVSKKAPPPGGKVQNKGGGKGGPALGRGSVEEGEIVSEQSVAGVNGDSGVRGRLGRNGPQKRGREDQSTERVLDKKRVREGDGKSVAGGGVKDVGVLGGRVRGWEVSERLAMGRNENVQKDVKKARVEARGLPIPPPAPLQPGVSSDTKDGLQKGGREQTEKAATHGKAQALPARRLDTERKDDSKKTDTTGASKTAARPVSTPLERNVDLSPGFEKGLATMRRSDTEFVEGRRQALREARQPKEPGQAVYNRELQRRRSEARKSDSGSGKCSEEGGENGGRRESDAGASFAAGVSPGLSGGGVAGSCGKVAGALPLSAVCGQALGSDRGGAAKQVLGGGASEEGGATVTKEVSPLKRKEELLEALLAERKRKAAEREAQETANGGASEKGEMQEGAQGAVKAGDSEQRGGAVGDERAGLPGNENTGEDDRVPTTDQLSKEEATSRVGGVSLELKLGLGLEGQVDLQSPGETGKAATEGRTENVRCKDGEERAAELEEAAVVEDDLGADFLQLEADVEESQPEPEPARPASITPVFLRQWL
jgi:hypothetical protein